MTTLSVEERARKNYEKFPFVLMEDPMTMARKTVETLMPIAARQMTCTLGVVPLPWYQHIHESIATLLETELIYEASDDDTVAVYFTPKDVPEHVNNPAVKIIKPGVLAVCRNVCMEELIAAHTNTVAQAVLNVCNACYGGKRG